MRHTLLFDQGSAEHPEDGFVKTSRIVGVLDGVNTPYNGSNPQVLYGSMSSAEMVVRTVEKILTLTDSYPLEVTLRVANHEIRRIQQDRQIPFEPRWLAGAAFALAQLHEHHVRVFQAGDCFCLVVLHSGQLVMSPYQSRNHERVNKLNREMIFEQVAQKNFGVGVAEVSSESRAILYHEFWESYLPIWMQQRSLDINNARSEGRFGLLNGQPEVFELMWRRSFPRKLVHSLLFFSDGMVPLDVLDTKEDDVIAKFVYELYVQAGWPGVLKKAREGISIHYAMKPEATGLTVEFDE